MMHPSLDLTPGLASLGVHTSRFADHVDRAGGRVDVFVFERRLSGNVGSAQKPGGGGNARYKATGGVYLTAAEAHEIRGRNLLVVIGVECRGVEAVAGHDVELHHPAAAAKAAGGGIRNQRIEH